MKQIQKKLQTLGVAAGSFSEKYIPDPWILAIFLTLIAYSASVLLTDATLWGTLTAWHDGFWNQKILTLIAQFSINLILCTTLAKAPPIESFLIKIAKIPKSAFFAIFLISIVSIILSLISWALYIVRGALFAQEVCRQAHRRELKIHYPLAIAAGYLGMITWGCGLTSSAALISSTPGHFLEKSIGVIAVSQTLGSTANIVIVLSLALVCPLLMASMHPKSKIYEFLPPEEKKDTNRKIPKTFSEKIENSTLFLKFAAFLPISFLVNYYIIQGNGLTIDSMNLVFLTAVMLTYSTPKNMLLKLSQAASGVWSIVFQFPFYAGLMGMIKTTGLGLLIAQFFADISTPLTWPTLGILFQGLLNVFIPSGGTQWIVSGEVLVNTSEALGFSYAHAVLVEIMGDQLTNMIQPMWALPALAISGLQAKNIMGYTGVIMFFAFIVMALGLTFLPV